MFINAWMKLLHTVWNCWETAMYIDTLSSRSKHDLKPPLHVETFSWNVCNGAVKQVSAGVAPCNLVGFVKLFELPLRDKFHEKWNRLLLLQRLATVAVVKKQEFHCVTPLRETGPVRRCTEVSTCNGGFRFSSVKRNWGKQRTCYYAFKDWNSLDGNF